MNIHRDYAEKQHRLRDDLLTSAPSWLVWYLNEHLGDVPETPAPEPVVRNRGTPSALDFHGPRRLAPWDQRTWR
jgi:hypothetical protein